MPQPYLFISYKHGDPSTRIARFVYDYFLAVSDGLGFDIFMDDKSIVGGDQWTAEVEQALARTTHFLALLDTAYWLSPECRRELRYALNGWETRESPRLLFVKAAEIRPDLFTFNKDRQTGELTSDDPQVKKVGDLHFLGPFDGNTQLVRLQWEDPAKLGDQVAQLLARFEQALKRKPA